MGASSIKEGLLTSIKTDNTAQLSSYLSELVPNEYINSSKTFTALNICAAFGSKKCCELLIKKGWKVDLPEKENGNSPLLLTIKFGYEDLTKIFINDFKANIKYVNYAKLNCLDYAILYSRYSIAYYLMYELGMKITKSINEYKKIMKNNDIYLYPIEPFINDLLSKMKNSESIYIPNNGNFANLTERNEKTIEVEHDNDTISNMSVVDVNKIEVLVDKNIIKVE